jgi:hypothetical protein
MKNLIVLYCKRLLAGASLLLFLALLLTACSGNGAIASSSLNTVGLVQSDAPQAPLSQNTPGSRQCPGKANNLSYWNKIIGTRGDAKVESVSCGKLMIYPGLQALILVRHHSTGSIADVYVYANILSYKPAQFFKLPDLLYGNAKISVYNTVLTAQAQKSSTLLPDLFREFKWSDGAGAFEQTVFPGMFPDMTRYQAEADQAEVNQGHQPWKLDALDTTKSALGLFKRDPNNPVTLVSGGGLQDAYAVVRVEAYPQGSGAFAIIVKLSRLEGNTHGGIWEIVAVQGDHMSLTAPVKGALLTSPTTVKGSAPLFEAEAGVVEILDSQYTKIGSAIATGSPFSVRVSYTSSFHGGAQEGIVSLYHQSGANTPFMVKVLLRA